MCHEIIRLSTSLNCICLDDDVLDEMGDLGQTFCGLSIHSKDDESSCDRPLEPVEQTVSDPPPSYEQVFPETVIESVLMQVHHRCRVLNDAGCIRLVVEELERVLSRHPGYQGKNYHSALLYQALRKLYIHRKQFTEALANLEFEFRSLPFDFIESHDPEAIIEYVKVLQALGRTEEAFTFLSQHATQTSRPYIRRQAALWRAQIYEEKGHAREAENAFIEALITAHQDPEAYLALIHHYHTRGESALAQALTGVMKTVILPSPQWREYSDNLQTYIRDHLPESLRDGKYSEDDLMTAIKLWIGRGQLEESSKYWIPLIRHLCKDGGRYIFFGDDQKSLKKMLLDLVNELSMSPDQRLQYYKALYNHREDWSHNGFYSDAAIEAILYALNKEFRDPDQVFEMAQFIVDKQRESGYFERHNANIEALEVVVEGHLSRKDTEQAIIVFIDLIRQFKWDNTSHTLQDLMMQLAPVHEYRACDLHPGKYVWQLHLGPLCYTGYDR